MRYKEFRLRNYRCFTDEERLIFALPNGEIGSGITYLVGENNSGKTSILEAMQKRINDMIRSGETDSSKCNMLELTLIDESGAVRSKLELIRQGSHLLGSAEGIPPLEESAYPYFISSRRHWSPRIMNTGAGFDAAQYRRNATRESMRSSENSMYPLTNVDVAGMLKAFELDEDRYKSVLVLMRQVLPDFCSFSISLDDYEFVSYTTKDGREHRADLLGDGVVSVLRIVCHLVEYEDVPLVIDEPELSLHPLAQKRLMRLLAERAKNQQIVLSTHEPYFIQWEYIKNGAILNKVTKNDGNCSKIHQLSPYEEYNKLINPEEYQKPYLMDELAKEIFFCDNILFVEGLEDAGLLRMAEVLPENITIFGYGVGGKDKFRISLKLAQDIGIENAAALLDGGEDEAVIKTQLNNEFPEYLMVQWNKHDIRDKGQQECKECGFAPKEAKSGYFTSRGTLKEDVELDDFYSKISIIKEYFGQ